MFAKFIKAKNKIGFNKENTNVFKYAIDAESTHVGLHYILRCLKPLKFINIETADQIPKPELFTDNDSESYINHFLESVKIKNYIVANISASNINKMWISEKWIELLSNQDFNDINIILSFAPSEKELAIELKNSVPKLNVFNSRSMNDVISLIKRTCLLITPDTSLVHVAAAFNIPILGMFSGLDDFYKKFEPLSDVKESVRSPHGVDGIKGIESKDVIDAFLRIRKTIDI